MEKTELILLGMGLVFIPLAFSEGKYENGVRRSVPNLAIKAFVAERAEKEFALDGFQKFQSGIKVLLGAAVVVALVGINVGRVEKKASSLSRLAMIRRAS